MMFFARFSVFLSFCLLFSCVGGEKKGKKQKEQMIFFHPFRIDTTYCLEYVADIQAIQNVELRSRIKGFIEKIHVDEGQKVHAGQVLFTLSNQEFYQELLRANAQLKSAIAESKIAEVELKNTTLLVDKNIVSKSELEMSNAKYDAARAKIEEGEAAISRAKFNIAFTIIKAPFSGIINRIPLKVGSLIDEATLLTSISNISQFFAYFNLSEKEYLTTLREMGSDGHLGEVRLVLVDGSTYKYNGLVETSESEIDKNTGNLAFRARFPNPEGFIKHGASGKIQIFKKLKNVLLIPQKSTFDIQENTYIYVINKEDVIESRRVVVKNTIPHLYIVEAGLEEGDRVLYEGLQKVKEGQKVLTEEIKKKDILNELRHQ